MFMGIYRVYGDISSLWGYIEFMGIFRVIIFTSCIVGATFNFQWRLHKQFSMETAQTITNVRKVEMYDRKLIPNFGQFYTTEKIIRVR